MQRYKSKYTGPQMDVAFERALPGGAIDQLRPNRNLLDNWDFRNPVNQRGQTSYSVYNRYTIDRWRLEFSQTGCQVQIASGGVKFVAAAGGWTLLGQLIEGINKVNGAVTLSAVIDGTLYSVTTTLVAGSNAAFNQDFTTDWNFSIQNRENGRTSLLYSGTGTPVISAIKLELGSVSTLANDPPVDYGAELTRCKRYFNLWASEAARTAALLEVGAMRTTPVLSTIDIGGVTYYTASADL